MKRSEIIAELEQLLIDDPDGEVVSYIEGVLDYYESVAKEIRYNLDIDCIDDLSNIEDAFVLAVKLADDLY